MESSAGPAPVARRVDRVDDAGEAEARQVGERPAADLVGVVRSADHGDRARRQRQPQRIARVEAHELSLMKCGSGRPAIRRTVQRNAVADRQIRVGVAHDANALLEIDEDDPVRARAP
jgi:hypothetical protein